MTKIVEFSGAQTFPLRLVWPHESQNFAPWLASNIDRLADALGVPLAAIGPATTNSGRVADLLAKDLSDDSIVLIESQLGPADHDHLGRILAYLAGFNAKTVVWVADEFQPSLLSAIRWLNENTASPFAFFALRLRVSKIGVSRLEPVFEVLEGPRGWDRMRHKAPVAANSVAHRRAVGAHASFWSHFLARHPDEAARSRQLGERCRWRTSPPAKMVVGQQVLDDAVRVFIRGRNGMPIRSVMRQLRPFADTLESQLGGSLSLEEGSIIAVKRLPIASDDPANWDRMAAWLHDQTDLYEHALRGAFGDQA